MKQATITPGGVAVAPVTVNVDSELSGVSASDQLREALQAGRIGLQGAVACYPELSIQQITTVARQVHQERTAASNELR